MEPRLNDGSWVPRTIRPPEHLWRDSKFLAEPESPRNVIDLHGDYHGNLHSAQRAEIHQYRF